MYISLNVKCRKGSLDGIYLLQIQFSLIDQKLSSIEQRFFLKGSRLDRGIDLVERVHNLLDVGLIHLCEKVLDSILILDIVKDEKALLAGGHKGGDVPLVELVHHLQVHVRGPEHVLVHEVEGGVGDELVEVTVVILPTAVSVPGPTEFQLEERVVPVAHDDKVVGSRHSSWAFLHHLRTAQTLL